MIVFNYNFRQDTVMEKEDKVVLVTGGAGYIGSALVQSLLQENYEVVVLDNLINGQKELLPKEVDFIEGDILNKENLTRLFSDYKFDSIFHLAAKKAVGESEIEPYQYYQNNVQGTLNLLEVMANFAVEKIVFSSTAAVYKEDHKALPIVERSDLLPINVYGHTKLIAEQMIQHYFRLGKIKHYTIFRYFNVAGDCGLQYQDQNAKNVFPILAQAYKSQGAFKVFGNDYATSDGTCVRDYIHVNDIVSAHLQALKGNYDGAFNLGNTHGFSVLELIKEFSAVTGKTITVQEEGRRLGDPAYLVADAQLAKETLGWRPQYDLKSMVESTLKAEGFFES